MIFDENSAAFPDIEQSNNHTFELSVFFDARAYVLVIIYIVTMIVLYYLCKGIHDALRANCVSLPLHTHTSSNANATGAAAASVAVSRSATAQTTVQI